MNEERKAKVIKYIVVMLIGLGLNIGLYWTAHTLDLPMWLDTVGTAAAAAILEPAAGLIIGYATNLFESSAVYMSDTIIYFAITASCALVFGLILRKNGRLSWKRLPLAALCYVLISAVLSAAISIWRGSLPSSSWELMLYMDALSVGVPRFPAYALSAGALKLVDSAVMCAVTPLLYSVLPEKLKNVTFFSSTTWKSPFKESK